MRHRKARGRLGRSEGARKACVRNIAASLLTFEKITTTVAKAKEARQLAERLITLAKNGGLSNLRRAASLLGQNKKEVVHRLFKDIAPRFKNRNGGYTRVIRRGWRLGDNAPLVILELTEQEKKKELSKAKATKKEELKPEPEKEKKEAPAKKIWLDRKKTKVTEKKPKEKFFRKIFKRERDGL